jgi:glutamine amidotransferase
MIVIVDYGLGNLGSIKNMLKKIGFESHISSNYDDIKKSSKLILPGVGSFDVGMRNLKNLDLIDLLNQKVLEESTPILGICLGAQLMCMNSEEGVLDGLGWFNARVVSFKNRLNPERRMPIPNMGWNKVEIKNINLLTNNLSNLNRFYFVHSYFIQVTNKEDSLMETTYGIDYTCAISRNNIFGVQFHPEKSHKYGFQLLKNFATI